jgi:multicomponent Na+:H+ antiporter subunit C
MMIGLYAMIAKNNLVKKIIGMNILQTAVILFFISIGAKTNATIPIIMHGHAAVSTLGVALALVIKLYQQYQTLEEDEILEQLRVRDE